MSFSYLSGYTAAVKNIHQQEHKIPTKISSTSEVLSQQALAERACTPIRMLGNVLWYKNMERFKCLWLSMLLFLLPKKVPEQGTMMSGISIILVLKTFSIRRSLTF